MAFHKAAAIIGFFLLPLTASFGQAPVNALSPDQMDTLVAPVALYPDPLLGQVLAASTYPLELVEAQQWLQQNGSLHGAQLVEAAKQQNWDPSVQAMVAFPDAMRLLCTDIRWTTDLGNAFLAQQSDVMNAVQRMRARANVNGRLHTTPQQVVTFPTQGDQRAIEIQPANPQVIYVPVYQPAYVWGPPLWDPYPDLWYAGGFGFGWGPGIFIGGFYPGWVGWGGWGWGCGWFGNSLFVNGAFFNRFGFRGGSFGRFGGGFGSRTAWAHNPAHRLSVPYANRSVASRFNSSRFVGNSGVGRFNSGGAARSFTGGAATQSNRGAAPGGWRSFNGANNNRGGFTSGGAGATRSFNSNSASRMNQPSPNSAFRGGSQNYRAPAQAYRGGQTFSQPSTRSFSAPRQSFSTPRSFSAPSQGSASRSFSSPHFSGGGHSGGFSGGGGRSFSGGHGGGGGGHHR